MKNTSQTLSDHLEELRSRLLKSAGAVLGFSILMYAWHNPALRWLSHPLDLPLYYLSPAGGFLLAVNVSLLFGCILAIPVVAWQVTRFLAPAVPDLTKANSFKFIFWSLVLAACGVAFAYYLTLPAAIRFLNDFSAEGVSPLITAEEYVRFAMLYLAGFALIFQLPLIVWIINRFTPLKPATFFKAQRGVILGSFIMAAILTPTPDPFNQLLMALPPIILYYFSISLVWFSRPKSKPVAPARSMSIDVDDLEIAHHVPVKVIKQKYWDIIPA